MAYDEDLTGRVRGAFSQTGRVREVKMFGGVGFMLNGNMVAAASQRGLLVRVGKDRHRDALTRPGTRAMEMRGRVMEGYVYVDPAILDDESLRDWIRLAAAFVETLPPKRTGASPKRTKGGRK
jgi:TfoX/Sxy family transcriptional regulator of competence genes